MEALKFATIVLENGVIKIPELENYINKKVEVFVVLEPDKVKGNNKLSMKGFLSKWTGFFSHVANADDDKYNYLMEKYK